MDEAYFKHIRPDLDNNGRYFECRFGRQLDPEGTSLVLDA